MKFCEIFCFELAYQTRRGWSWLIFAVLIVLCFLMTRDGTLAEALYAEFFINSPFAIAKTTVFGSLIWLMVAAVVAGEAEARDVSKPALAGIDPHHLLDWEEREDDDNIEGVEVEQ